MFINHSIEAVEKIDCPSLHDQCAYVIGLGIGLAAMRYGIKKIRDAEFNALSCESDMLDREQASLNAQCLPYKEACSDFDVVYESLRIEHTHLNERFLFLNSQLPKTRRAFDDMLPRLTELKKRKEILVMRLNELQGSPPLYEPSCTSEGENKDDA